MKKFKSMNFLHSKYNYLSIKLYNNRMLITNLANKKVFIDILILSYMENNNHGYRVMFDESLFTEHHILLNLITTLNLN